MLSNQCIPLGIQDVISDNFFWHFDAQRSNMMFRYGAENLQIDRLVQERRNSIANALELRLSCTNPLRWWCIHSSPLRWRHNGRDSVSNHQPRDCLLNRLFRCRSKKTSKLRVTGLCAGNSLGTGEFPAQMASNAENVSIWWLHHAFMNMGTIAEKFQLHSLN